MDNNDIPEGLRTLLIDDEPFMRDLLQASLRHIGVNDITLAADGAEALSLVERGEQEFDLVVCDLYMPRMDGIEFLRYLPQCGFRGGIVLLSGKDQKVLRSAVQVARERHLNVLGSLPKPVSADDLRRVIERITAYDFDTDITATTILTEHQIQTGIEAGHLRLYYQPQVDLNSGQVMGVEALARWYDPQQGTLGPTAVVPVIEGSRLIHAFTDAALFQAIRQQREWQSRGLQLRVAVNISVSALERLDLPERIEALCQELGVDPSSLAMEITETHFAADSATALDVLTRLKLKGLGLSLDDFGTGYSTLEQLQRAPFDEMKVDHSFVHGAKFDPAARTILESSVELGRRLGLALVAEGAEDAQDWRLTQELGCQTAQGFYISQALPPAELEKWLGEWAERYPD
jgi:EAL domain-containing protein (putative c-di-GMP-specific phosphodiesterase class I)